MTKPTAFEEACALYRNQSGTYGQVGTYRDMWFFNAGRQAERDAQDVPPEDTKREQEDA